MVAIDPEFKIVANAGDFLGMQALATSLAARGGLGIGDFIIRSVTRSENKNGQPPAQQEKNLAKGAPLERLF